MKEKNKGSRNKSYMSSAAKDFPPPISYLQAFFVHLICGLGLAIPFWVACNFYSINLISDPSRTLLLIWIVESVVVVLLYSLFRFDPQQCSYFRAVGRGLLALPVGALVNLFGAVVLGAPVGIEYLQKTVNWSLLMSSFTFVPAACAFGSSWTNWRRIFALTKPKGILEHMICIPAHGAVIGGWFGAWPMPLDWERLWQEWPICVTYGAVAGYLLGMLACFGLVLIHGEQQRFKAE